MRNKRGAELTIGTLVVIVLAIAVLIFLIWGFSSGWTNAWGKITALIGGGTNVDVIKQGCSLSCTSNQETAYCEEIKNVKKADGTKIRGSCKTLESQDVTDSCSSISCDKLPKKCEGTWVEKSCPEGEEDLTDQVGDSEGENVNKMKCCV